MRRHLPAWATLVTWAVLEWTLRRHGVITDDWQGWRQADTQAIARNFAEGSLQPLWPRIDWGGDGPGYVETEFALVPAIIALVLGVVGPAEWPGQLLSLVCCVATGWVLYAELARRFDPRSASIGLLALLSVRGVVVAGTSIQPDPFGLLAFAVGWVELLRWLEAPSRRRWALWVLATTLAGLVKPTLLALGLAQGVVALAHPRALRRPGLWLGWALVLVVTGAYLWHARTLYLSHGNTFGLLSGGDSKLPILPRIVEPSRWLDLLRFMLTWGTGLLGAAAGLFLAWRRKLRCEEVALAFAGLALSVVAFRYTSHKFGTHYHLPLSILGAWLVAHAAAEAQRRWLYWATGAAAIALYAGSVRFIDTLPPEPETELGQRLADAAQPGTLVVVRARAPSYEPLWQTTNNYQDPRVFYLSRTKGWVLPSDATGSASLQRHWRRGARYYVHVRGVPFDAELRAWLTTHGARISKAPAGELWKLRQAQP